MPEGPEVRNMADVLQNDLVGKHITEVELSEVAKVSNFELFEDYRELCSETKRLLVITKVWAYGKKLIMEINYGALAIMFSLGMTGCFRYTKSTHSHLIFSLAEQLVKEVEDDEGHFKPVEPREYLIGKINLVSFTDTRRFGQATFFGDGSSKSGINAVRQDLESLGPDLLEHALTTPIKPKAWRALFARTGVRGQLKIGTRQICQILLEQEFVAGIGNYLKSEILYYSGIVPFRAAADLSDEEWETIRQVAHHIIKVSYQYGGLTIESYTMPNDKIGRYPVAIYGKTKDPKGFTVLRGETADKRTSYWVEEVQD